MKKILLSLTIGLAAGYGVTNAFENAEISQLQKEHRSSQLQVVKLSEQILILQKESRQSSHIVQQQIPTQQSKNLASASFHKKKRTNLSQEQVIRAQQSNNTLKDKQVKTTENGIIL